MYYADPVQTLGTLENATAPPQVQGYVGEVGTTQWWDEKDCSINGVFKGGGAKGLLYAGALSALAAHGYWFRAVAGSSAGAITATLIAAGLSIDEIYQAVPDALRRIRHNLFGDVVGQPLIDVKNLHKWLENELVRQVERLHGERRGDDPVSFAELYETTGIELYVVCVDVALRQPVVLSSHSTPGLSVSAAVMASSAIPFAFRPGRVEVRNEIDGTTRVHRLMDGGMWANYPVFVFKDASFRTYHSLPNPGENSVTIGFTLEYGAGVAPTHPTRFLTNWVNVHSDRGALLKGIFRFPPFRLYFFTLVPIVIAAQAWWTIDRYGLLFLKETAGQASEQNFFTSLLGWFDGFFSSFWPGFVSVVVIVVAISLVMILMGSTLLDSGIPAIRSLMAVGTNVPYWVGSAPGDHLVKLTVPSGLGTLKFRLEPASIGQFVESAENEARAQIERILGPHEAVD